MDTETRICSICKIEKSMDNFAIRKNASKYIRKNAANYYQCNLCKKEISTKWNKNNSLRRLATNARQRAKKYNLECTIDYKWVLSYMPNTCPCCGITLNLGVSNGRGHITDNRPSIDRFCPNIGYTARK